MNQNKSVDDLLQKGYQYLEQGKFSQAFEVFEYVDNSFLDDERIKYALGLTYLVQEQHKIIGFNSPDSQQLEQAIAYFDKAIQLQPNHLLALAKRGTVLGLLGKKELAFKDCERVLKSKLETNQDWHSAGTVFFAMLQIEQALQCYEKALDIKSEDSESLLYKALCLESLQQSNLAIATYQKTLQISPRKILALINYGRSLTNLNNNHEALQCFDKALSIKPNSCAALLWRGIVLDELNRLEEALQSIDLAIKKYNKNAFLWGQKGRILRRMQKEQDALFCLEQALSINPDFTLAKEEKSKLILFSSKDNRSVGKKDLKTEFESIEQYIRFLLSLFHVYDNGGGKEQIYSLLIANLDKLNLNLAKAIKFWMFDVFSPRTHSREEELLMASVILDLSSAILIFPHGDISDNTEIAIVGYQTVISLFPKQKFPRKWLTAQNNLVMAFWQRKIGDTKENLELSIKACQSALEIATEGKYPFDWSGVQLNLSIAYLYRIEGVKRENLELAKNAVENALKIRTEHKYPREWAEAQNNLGLIYFNRIEGDRKENIRQAIAAFKKAMKVREEHKLRTKLAETQNNIACAYLFGTTDNRKENIELAISYFEKAHKVYTKSHFPDMWAGVNTNLGLAYNSRQTGNPSENARLAISALESALEIRTSPYDRAETQVNLGIAYLHHKEPSQQQQNIERAIEVFLLASEVYTKDDVPLRWAKIQVNLGDAYLKRTMDKKQDNTKKAINYYLAALSAYTTQENPLEYLVAARKLGQLAFDLENWQLAIQAYSSAIEAIETSRSWSTDDVRRQEIIAESMNIYYEIVQACINEGQIETALEYAERSRCRRLVDLMASNDLYSNGIIPPEVVKYLEDYRALEKSIDEERISNNENQNTKGTPAINLDQDAYRAKLRLLNSNIPRLETEKEKVWRKIRAFDRVLSEQIKVSSVAFDEICQLIPDSETTIVYFQHALDKLYTFVVFKNKVVKLHATKFNVQEFVSFATHSWFVPYLDDNEAWKKQLPQNLVELADKLNLCELVENHLQDVKELIIIPHLHLHSFPFAALPIDRSSQELSNNNLPELLCDRFRIRILPSAQVLQFCHRRDSQKASALSYGTIEDADNSLPFARCEGEQIAQMFDIPDTNRLRGKTQATVDNYHQLIGKIQVLHSSHHASSRLDKPLESRLSLADGTISLGMIMSPGWRLPDLEDVFLSCCETNLGRANLTDDPLTLATGFLCAGARSVVSTLWSVDDFATAIFSIIYYQLRKDGLNRSTALQQAQHQLKSMTGEELKLNLRSQHKTVREKRERIKSKIEKLSESAKQTSEYIQLQSEKKVLNRIEKILWDQMTVISDKQKKSLVFSHPYYWAGFISQGLR